MECDFEDVLEQAKRVDIILYKERPHYTDYFEALHYLREERGEGAHGWEYDDFLLYLRTRSQREIARLFLL
jgi:hypothetical protein